MSQKVAVVVMVEHAQPSDRGRMAHALNLARDLHRAETEFQFVFAGKAVEWLAEFTAQDRAAQHPFVRNYADHFDAVRSHVRACNFCCRRFGQLDLAQAQDIPIVGEGKEHMHLGELIAQGYQIVTF